jgi:hypothetical protein
MEKRLSRGFPMDFEVEGAEMTALTAKWNVEIQAERSVHRFKEKGSG